MTQPKLQDHPQYRIDSALELLTQASADLLDIPTSGRRDQTFWIAKFEIDAAIHMLRTGRRLIGGKFLKSKV